MRTTTLIPPALSRLWATNYWIRSLVFNSLIWGGILTLGAWGSYRDNIKFETNLRFLDVWMHWLENDALLFALSTVLYPLLGKYPQLMTKTKNTILLYIGLSLFFYPFHALFQLFVSWHRFVFEHRDTSYIDYVIHTKYSSWFFCYGYFAAILTVIICVRIWHENRARQASLLNIQTDNLKLNLALEQQKLQSLRQQLEPHFIFNALNAISALVRTNEKSVALTGIHQLSDLLRYALLASNKTWVSIKDELDFIRDYLALQQLRYGDRLVVSIEGLKPEILHADCLPLLLQPLIENALRHDLDCHDDVGHITLTLGLIEQQVQITIHNDRHNHAESNPGLGLGLPQTQLRLEMMYKGAASMTINQTDKQFTITIHMPLHRPESS